MKLEGEYVFEAPVADVWSALMDPKVLAAVMPGCEKLDVVEGHYEGELNIKMGPISGQFAGKVTLEDVDEPRSYKMIVDGRGAPGFVKATATVKLEPEGEGTKLVYAADAQIGGKIATVGQRLVDASAKAIAKQALEGLHDNVKARRAAKAEPAAPPPPVVKVDEKAYAASVAKEVTKSVAPRYGLYLLVAVAAAIVLWLVLRR